MRATTALRDHRRARAVGNALRGTTASRVRAPPRETGRAAPRRGTTARRGPARRQGHSARRASIARHMRRLACTTRPWTALQVITALRDRRTVLVLRNAALRRGTTARRGPARRQGRSARLASTARHMRRLACTTRPWTALQVITALRGRRPVPVPGNAQQGITALRDRLRARAPACASLRRETTVRRGLAQLSGRRARPEVTVP